MSLNEAFWSANHRFNTDNVYDIGNSGTERPRNMYLTSTITGGRRGVAADQGRFVITTDTVGSSNSPDLYLVTSTAGTFTCGSIFIEPGGSNSLGLSASGTGGNVIIRGGNGSTTNGSIEIRSGAGIGTAGDVRLGTGNTNRWGINGSRLFAVSDGIYDIGADGDLRPQTLYLTTSIIGGNEGSNFSIAGPASATSGVAGTSISIACGAGNTTGNGGSFVLSAGLGGDSVASTTDAANGGSITIVAAAGGIGNATGPQSAGDGGNLILDAGPAGAANGGNFGIAGTLSLGVTNASSIVIGNTSATCNIAASNITVNSLPLPSVLSTTSVDLTSTGDNTLYTVPTGFSAKILGVMITPTVVTAPNGDATISVGTNVTRDDIFTAQALTGLNTTTESYTIWATGIVHLAAASELIRFEVDSADTGTAITVDVDLIGYLV